MDRTAGAIDPVSRTLLTEILVSNHDGKLFPGAHAMVRVNLATGVDPVVVPVNTLLFRNEQGVQAGVVDSNGIVRLADVTVGRDYGTTVEIVAWPFRNRQRHPQPVRFPRTRRQSADRQTRERTPPHQPMNETSSQTPGLRQRDRPSVRIGAGRLRGGAGLPTDRLPAPLPGEWKAQPPWKEGQPRDAEIKQNFWEVFDDPVLTGLELEATTNSPDVRAAFERVEQARAVARITRADLYPGLSFDPNANRTHYSAEPHRAARIAVVGLHRQ